MDELDYAAQPICPACGVTMNPEDDGDECWECGYRIEWLNVRKPADDPNIIDF